MPPSTGNNRLTCGSGLISRANKSLGRLFRETGVAVDTQTGTNRQTCSLVLVTAAFIAVPRPAATGIQESGIAGCSTGVMIWSFVAIPAFGIISIVGGTGNHFAWR